MNRIISSIICLALAQFYITPYIVSEGGKVYSIISQGGKANLYDTSDPRKPIQSVDQWYAYDIIIKGTSIELVPAIKKSISPKTTQLLFNTISMSDRIPANGNYAAIRNIITGDNRIVVHIFDKGTTPETHLPINKKQTYPFSKHVPWDQDGNYFKIEIEN